MPRESFQISPHKALKAWSAVGGNGIKMPGRINQILAGDGFLTLMEKDRFTKFFDSLLEEVSGNLKNFGEIYRNMELEDDVKDIYRDLSSRNLLYFTRGFEACSTKKRDKSVAKMNSRFIYRGASGVTDHNPEQNEVLLPPGQTYRIDSINEDAGRFEVVLVRTGTAHQDSWNAQWLRKWEIQHKGMK